MILAYVVEWVSEWDRLRVMLGGALVWFLLCLVIELLTGGGKRWTGR